MALVTYTYLISRDFPNGLVAPDRLEQEIRGSSITIALDHITTAGGECFILFKAALSSEEQSLLTSIVGVHSGEPLPSGALPVSLDKDESSVQVAVIAESDFSPNPNSYPDGTLPSAIDSENNQRIRGQILTDEGSYRDDFPNGSLVGTLTGSLTFVNGSTTVTGEGTSFRTELNTDKYIWLTSDGLNYGSRVLVINSDAELELDTPYEGSSGSGGASLSEWLIVIGGGGSVDVSNSIVNLHSGTQADGSAKIVRHIDFLPLVCSATFGVSTRDPNTRVVFGFSDSLSEEETTDAACVYLLEDDPTKVRFSTLCQGQPERTEVTLPASHVTSSEILYEIELTQRFACLLVNGKPMATHKRHIPRAYSSLMAGIAVYNVDAVSVETVVGCDVFSCSNHNVVEVGGNFMVGRPMPTRSSEEAHSLAGKLTTISTDADQVILEYEVPAGRLMYLTGYHLSGPNNSVSGDPYKIGRNDVSVEPESPGVVDSSIIRMSRLPFGRNMTEDWSANPRLIGSGGDIVKFTVTPDGPAPSEWRAVLDYVLR